MLKILALSCLALLLCAANSYAASSPQIAPFSDPVGEDSSASGGQNSLMDSLPTPPAPPGEPGPPGAPAPAVSFVPSGFVEAGGNYNYVSNGFGNWAGQYLRGEVQTDPDNRWNAEGLNQREFHSTGVYGNVGNTHSFNEDWFSSVTLGAGDGGIYLPRYRADAFINRKWLDNHQLITTLGLGADKAMDAHKDASLFLGATYYFTAPWIIQGGVRINDSSPGDTTSTSQFLAVTQGEDKKHFLTLRYSFGHEAYQVIGPSQTLVNFPSQQVSLELRQWVGEAWGFDVRGEQYNNPNYARTGLNLGFFKEF